MTGQLDPALVRVVSDALRRHTFTAIVRPFGFDLDVALPEEVASELAAAAITAVDAHRAAAVREAVDALIEDTQSLLNSDSREMTPMGQVRLLAQLARSKRELLALVGAEESEK